MNSLKIVRINQMRNVQVLHEWELILSNAFLASIDMTIFFFILDLLMQM